MHQAIVIIQIISAVALIICVLLQAQGTGLSGAFGGGGMVYRSRRGVEKLLFKGTIVTAIILGLSSLLLVLL